MIQELCLFIACPCQIGLKSLSHISYNFLFWPVWTCFSHVCCNCRTVRWESWHMFLHVSAILTWFLYIFVRFCCVLMLFWLENALNSSVCVDNPAAELFLTAFTCFLQISLSSRNSLFVWAEQVFQCFYLFYTIGELALGDHKGDLQLMRQIHFS